MQERMSAGINIYQDFLARLDENRATYFRNALFVRDAHFRTALSRFSYRKLNARLMSNDVYIVGRSFATKTYLSVRNVNSAMFLASSMDRYQIK